MRPEKWSNEAITLFFCTASSGHQNILHILAAGIRPLSVLHSAPESWIWNLYRCRVNLVANDGKISVIRLPLHTHVTRKWSHQSEQWQSTEEKISRETSHQRNYYFRITFSCQLQPQIQSKVWRGWLYSVEVATHPPKTNRRANWCTEYLSLVRAKDEALAHCWQLDVQSILQTKHEKNASVMPKSSWHNLYKRCNKNTYTHTLSDSLGFLVVPLLNVYRWLQPSQ